MKVLFETERCNLRPFKKGDGTHFFHLNSDPDVLKYTGDSPFNTIQDAHDFIKAYNQYQKHGYGRWAVISKNSDDFLGWCGLKYEPDTGETDLGYRFYQRHWGLGFATETAKASISYGFNTLNLKTIVGRAYLGNEASINVLKKCGMTYEKHMLYYGKEAVMYRINCE